MREKSSSLRGWQVVSGALKGLIWLCVIVLMMFPFYWGLVTSFKPLSELDTDPPLFWPKNFAGWQNYSQVFKDLPMGRYYLNSFYVAAVGTLAVLLTSALVGYIFEKFNFRGKNAFFLGIVATMMVPSPVRMIPLYLLYRDLHLLNRLEALIVGSLVSAYGIFLMRQYMKTIPSELIDAGRIDGANEFYIFGRIVLPLCKPVLSALAIFHFMGEWDSFLWPLIVVNDLDKRTIPLGIQVYRYSQGLSSFNMVMASAMLAMIPVVVVFLLGQRQFIQGITLSGLKG